MLISPIKVLRTLLTMCHDPPGILTDELKFTRGPGCSIGCTALSPALLQSRCPFRPGDQKIPTKCRHQVFRPIHNMAGEMRCGTYVIVGALISTNGFAYGYCKAGRTCNRHRCQVEEDKEAQRCKADLLHLQIGGCSDKWSRFRV